MEEAIVAKLRQGRGSHAYLLLGSPVQASQFFERVARELNTHPADKLLIEDDEISIEAVRRMIGRLIQRPFGSSHKLALVIGKLWGVAAAAALKVVEEPPGQTVFFIQAEHVEDLPVTLASRLEKLRLWQAGVGEQGDFPAWAELAQMSRRELFALASELAKQGQAAAFINHLMLALRQQLVYDMTIQTKIERCLEAKRQLQFNINERLLLETLLLHLR